jgi:hypothetical protein
MQNNVKLIAVVAALIVSVLMYLFLVRNGDESKSTYVSSDWKETGGPADLVPNGYGIFSNLLCKKHAMSAVQVANSYDTLKEMPAEGSLYLVIGDKVAFLEKEWVQIKKAVEAGATLFVGANRLSGILADEVLQKNALRYSYSESINAAFFNDQKKYLAYKIFQNDTIAQKWYFIDTKVLEEPLTFIDKPQFAGSARFRLGKGQIILYLNTDLLRNYQLNRPEWRSHVQRFISEVPAYKRVFWLSFGLLGENEKTITQGDNQGNNQGDKEDSSLLKLFFANRVLTMALILIAVGSILFILFRIRRRRPVVPLPIKERQHAKEFTETVTSIFINRRNPYGILKLQRKNFYGVVQRYYYMDVSKVNSDRHVSIALLSEKSGVDKESILRILQLLETKVHYNVTDDYLFDVYNHIQDFYQKAGIQQYSELKIQRESKQVGRSINQILLLVSVGLVLFVSGLWLLTMAQSIGVLIFIIAFVLLAWGFRLMNIPLLSWSEEELVVSSIGFSKRVFLWKDLRSVESDTQQVIWRFAGNGQVIMRWSEISRFDQGQLQRLIEIKSKNNGYVR